MGKLTLQKKIGVFVLVGLAGGLGLFSWLGVQSVDESIKKVLDERLIIARVMASHLDGTLTNIDSQLRSAADFGGQMPAQKEFESAADLFRETLARSLIVTRNVFLIDGQGKVLMVVPRDSQVIGTNMGSYSEVKKTLQSGTSSISGLVSSPQIGAPVVLFSAAILNDRNETIGGLVSAVDMEESRNDALRPVITVGKTGYTEIVDNNGIVLSRTEPGSPLKDFEQSDHPGRFAMLINQRTAIVRTCHRCHETEKELVRRRDILAFAPLSSTSWGVAIRQSEEEALAGTQQLQRRLLLIGIVVLLSAFFLSWMMIQGIVNPIRALTSAARKVAKGELETAVPLRRQQDEIGELSQAFNTMTQELARARDELVLRNTELSVLNSITATVSQSLALDNVLENALQKVLEISGATAGCVFLCDAASDKFVTKLRRGPADIFRCQESGVEGLKCACHQVARDGQTLMVNDVSQCPRLAGASADGISLFVSVPLKSKDKTLGILNVAGSREIYFKESDFRLLASIGSHVGLSIENSMLYEEAKQREKLRGQLLESAISAQEEERKRIARELHDELGQTLTGLIMSIESLENLTVLKEAQFKDKLGSVKTLVAHTLDDVRRLTLDLRPSALDDLGLVAAVRAYTQNRLTAAGIRAQFENRGSSKRQSPAVETALFRIIQEAVNNIIKHAGASRASIQLEVKGDEIIAVIEDDGKGFDVEAVFESRVGKQSFGLLGIKERITLLGGTLGIESRVGHGTRLMVKVPASTLPDDNSPIETRTENGLKSGKGIAEK